MPPRRMRISSLVRTALALAIASLFSDTAMALDWRVIQDQIGRQVGLMEDWPLPSTSFNHTLPVEAAKGRQGEVLFEENFEGGTVGKYPGHPGFSWSKIQMAKGVVCSFQLLNTDSRIGSQSRRAIGL